MRRENLVLTADGEASGMERRAMGPGPELMGMPFTAVEFKGKLYAETLEGCVRVKAQAAKLEILNPVGRGADERWAARRLMAKFGSSWTERRRASRTVWLWSRKMEVANMKFSERQPDIGKSAGRRMERGWEKDSRSDGWEGKKTL